MGAFWSVPLGLGVGADAFGHAVDVVEVRDHLDGVVDRGIVETHGPQRVGLGRADLRRRDGERACVVTQRPGARVEIGSTSVVVFGVVGELAWGALGTEVVGMRAASVVALVGRGDDRCQQLALLSREPGRAEHDRLVELHGTLQHAGAEAHRADDVVHLAGTRDGGRVLLCEWALCVVRVDQIEVCHPLDPTRLPTTGVAESAPGASATVGSMKRRRSLAFLAVVSLIAVGASTVTAATAPSYPVQLNATDDEAARAAMLRRSDLRPAGNWAGGIEPFDPQGVVCEGYNPKLSDLVVTGGVLGAWQRGPLVYGAGVAVFKTRRMLELDIARTITAEGLACALGSTVMVVRSTPTRFRLPGFPTPSVGFRVKVDLTQNGTVMPYVVLAVLTGWQRMELQTFVFAPRAQAAAAQAEVTRLLRVMLDRARG